MKEQRMSYVEMENASSALKTSSSNLNDILPTIKQLMEKVGNDGVWSGEAANSIRSKFDTLCAKFPEFQAAIESTYKYLDKVAADYREAENAIKNI